MGALPFATCPITSLTPPVWRFHVNCTVRGGKKGITKLSAVEVVLSQQNSDCRYYQPHLTLPEHHRAPDTVPAHTQPVPPLTGVSPCTCVCLRHTALRTAMGTLCHLPLFHCTGVDGKPSSNSPGGPEFVSLMVLTMPELAGLNARVRKAYFSPQLLT